MLTCPVCKLSQEPEAFHRDRSRATGRAVVCRSCTSITSHKRREILSARTERELRAATPKHKKCSRCQEVKPAAKFSRARSSPDALKSVCKSCASELWRRWRDSQQKQKQGEG